MPTEDEIRNQREETLAKLEAFHDEHGEAVVLVSLKASLIEDEDEDNVMKPHRRGDPLPNFGADLAIPEEDSEMMDLVRQYRVAPVNAAVGMTKVTEVVARIYERAEELDGIRLNWL